MYIIKTDEELRMERKILVEKRNRLQEVQDGLVQAEAELMQKWRLIKDPVVKREVHKEIFKLRDKILRGRQKQELDSLYSQIGIIDHYLYSKPSVQYGSIYDTYQNLDYDKISIYGIHGVKL